MFNVSRLAAFGLTVLAMTSALAVPAVAETATVTDLSGGIAPRMAMLRPGLLELVPQKRASAASDQATEQLTQTYLKCAYANLVTGEYHQTLAYLKPVLQCDPMNVEARRYAGVALLETGQARLACDNFQACICACGDAPELFDVVKLGDALRTASDYKRAIDAYAQALQLEPKCAEAYSGLARCYELVGMHQTAVLVRARGRQYGCSIESGCSEKILNGEYKLPTIRS